jgi:hypothetical protein
VDVDAGEPLAMVRASLEALVALPALRRSGHDDPVAGLDTFDHRPDFLHDSHPRVIHDRRPRVVVGSQRERRDRIAGHRGLAPDDDLARPNGKQPQLLDRNAVPIANERAKGLPGGAGALRPGARNLRGFNRTTEKRACTPPGGNRHTLLQDTSARDPRFLRHARSSFRRGSGYPGPSGVTTQNDLRTNVEPPPGRDDRLRSQSNSFSTPFSGVTYPRRQPFEPSLSR